MSSQPSANEPATPPTATASALTSATTGTGRKATASPMSTTPCTMKAAYELRASMRPQGQSPTEMSVSCTQQPHRSEDRQHALDGIDEEQQRQS